jgi:hypothetical protein
MLRFQMIEATCVPSFQSIVFFGISIMLSRYVNFPRKNYAVFVENPK